MSDFKAGGSEYAPISDYAMIGDCHTAALISGDGSIDWYCPRRFDDPALFCKLLDAEKGGYMRVAPAAPHTCSRQYRDSTNILEMTFRTGSGRARVVDFMPVYRRRTSGRGYDPGARLKIIRMIQGLDGEVEMELRFKPTFDYARAHTRVDAVDGGVIASANHHYAVLATPGLSFDTSDDGAKRATFRLSPGDQRWIVLSDANSDEDARSAIEVNACEDDLESTESFWRDWASRCTFRGDYSDEVLRSALTLKMLTYEPTGAMVAAPTTSLPEDIGGVRNWDYRFSWIRDSSLILYALMTIGYQKEATDFLHWLAEVRRADRSSTPQIMYGIDGARRLTEQTLDYLDGYRHSRPVRVGNAAYAQFQLDIFGEVLTAAYLHFHRSQREGEGNGKGQRPSRETWVLLRYLVDAAERLWQEPDNGIWEVRGGRQEFVQSRVMCWAALDRGIRLATEYQLDAPVERWKSTREQIRQAILTKGYNEKLGAFTQAFGSTALDASVLVIPRVGFLPPTDPRVRSTVRRIQEDLTHNGLVYRYRAEDGLPGGEGTFTLCTFWLVDALALGGNLDEAHDLFEKALSYTNDVGLLSEEIGSSSGTFLGNFPQGFTHLALVRSAVDLAKATKHGPEEEPENEAQRARKARHAVKQGYSRRLDSGRDER